MEMASGCTAPGDGRGPGAKRGVEKGAIGSTTRRGGLGLGGRAVDGEMVAGEIIGG